MHISGKCCCWSVFIFPKGVNTDKKKLNASSRSTTNEQREMLEFARVFSRSFLACSGYSAAPPPYFKKPHLIGDRYGVEIRRIRRLFYKPPRPLNGNRLAELGAFI